MEPLGVAIVGCGFMGLRHVAGYARLQDTGYDRVRVSAVMDLDREVAEKAAAECERRMGHRPVVHTSIEELVADDSVGAVDLVTDPATHAPLAVRAAGAGRHILSEKPLALTVRAARAMIEAAEVNDVVLATGENYRRGGPNRLARAVLDSGLLGRLHLMGEVHVGGDDKVIISPWRHRKLTGSIGLDMAIHYADIVEYYLGPVDRVWGRGRIAEPVRRLRDGTTMECDGEDTVIAQFITGSDVDVQFAYLPSGPGRSHQLRALHGSAGSMTVPMDRTHGQVEVVAGDHTLTGTELTEAVGFSLDPLTRALLGDDGTGGSGAEFGHIDSGYLAVEIADFVDAVIDGRAPEVDGWGGLRALAVVHAIFESGLRTEAVSVADVMDGRLHAYQDEIDRALEDVVIA